MFVVGGRALETFAPNFCYGIEGASALGFGFGFGFGSLDFESGSAFGGFFFCLFGGGFSRPSLDSSSFSSSILVEVIMSGSFVGASFPNT